MKEKKEIEVNFNKDFNSYNLDHFNSSDDRQFGADDVLLTAIPSLKVLDTCESPEALLNNADKAFLEGQLKSKDQIITVYC